MTRKKKKIGSVAGEKFVPASAPKKQRETYDPDSKRSRKQKNMEDKKKQKSVYQKHLDSQEK